MNDDLFTLSAEKLTTFDNNKALTALESGKVLYYPEYFFQSDFLTEELLLSEAILDGKHKNISFNYLTNKVHGFCTHHKNSALPAILSTFMKGYAQFARALIDQCLPQYQDHLIWGRTSYRPAEVEGRVSSKRKDDTRLHVDSFAATPVNGLRILRIFCNVNPEGKPRLWHLGEPFSQVIGQFANQLPRYNRHKAKFLQWIRATKTLRSAYDHYQLHLHDAMKLDDQYQNTVQKKSVPFAAQSTWVVFTDHVSHAALSGQFLLEQTFYLPVSAMQNEQLSPLAYWQALQPGCLSARR